ncbi:hypothetical protein GGS20DRAFT_136930 [Poronia punctata]|nr:hypothetical protein GGS20DRAFT_136930 [Poronia punctata]
MMVMKNNPRQRNYPQYYNSGLEQRLPRNSHERQQQHLELPTDFPMSDTSILQPPAGRNQCFRRAPTTPNRNSLNSTPDLMSSEPWMGNGQQITGQARRFEHQRDASLSSIGSNAPVSPYNTNTVNPQIAVADSVSEGLHEMGNATENNYTFAVVKPISTFDGYYQNGFGDNLTSHGTGLNGQHNNIGDMSIPDEPPALIRPQQQLGQAGLAPGVQASNASARSAASSVGGDSPVTPSLPEHDGGKNAFPPNNPLKLDRTVTDAFGDELYDSSFGMQSSTPTSKSHATVPSSTNGLFQNRLHAANTQHLAAAQSPTSNDSRDLSPFRQGSPYASDISEFPSAGTNKARLESERQRRERSEAEQRHRQQQKLAQNSHSRLEHQAAPTTISPKDAVLDFNESECDSSFPLFSPQEISAYSRGTQRNRSAINGAGPQQPVSPFQSMPQTPVRSSFDFSMSSNPPVAHTYHLAPGQNPQQTPSVSAYSRVSSAEVSSADLSSSDGHVKRPDRTAADGGTYTCTYHGCTLRFETPALLQKHKREGHRQTNVLNYLRDPVASVNSAANSQAGPHRCDRINPSTGKPCNTVFSRPYDLTRHEDTIHNARKKKVKCDLCTEEKTFSRADALTRHYRVCHPDVELQGKHRKRGLGL